MRHWFRYLPEAGEMQLVEEIEDLDRAILETENRLKGMKLSRAKMEKAAQRAALADWTEQEIMDARLAQITDVPGKENAIAKCKGQSDE